MPVGESESLSKKKLTFRMHLLLSSLFLPPGMGVGVGFVDVGALRSGAAFLEGLALVERFLLLAEGFFASLVLAEVTGFVCSFTTAHGVGSSLNLLATGAMVLALRPWASLCLKCWFEERHCQ